MNDRAREDLESDIVLELSARVRRLRWLVLYPSLVACASLFVPTYVIVRELTLAAQWDRGAEVAYEIPLVTGAFALLPVLITFALAAFAYHRVEAGRLRSWKRELSARYGVPESDLELGQIVH